MVNKEIRKSFLSQKSFIPYHKGQPQSFISVEFFSEHQKVFLHVESSIIFTVSFNMCKYTLVFIYHIKYFHGLLSLNTNLLLKLETFLEGIKEPQNLPHILKQSKQKLTVHCHHLLHWTTMFIEEKQRTEHSLFSIHCDSLLLPYLLYLLFDHGAQEPWCISCEEK